MLPGTTLEEANPPFATFRSFYERRNTIQHWQLRDLIAPGEDPNVVYCMHRNQTLRYNTVTDETQIIQDLAYGPTCLTVACGFVATGGHHSQLDVTRLSDNSTVYKSTVGASVNNALHIAEDHAGEVRLVISNNDETVKVYSLPDMALVATISCHVAINYAALSPSGEHLVCVGDCNHVFVYSCRNGYQRVATYTEAKDAGMCCAWNSTSSAFACVFQDGSVCVWELRTGKILAKVQTRGAARVVKYSSSPMDLLAFTEHEGTVHVVDGRTYNSMQSIDVSPDGQLDESISGLGFVGDGSRLYVGMEQGICVYDVDTAARRSFACGGLI